MSILWKCNVIGLGQMPEPDHPSYLFFCQTGQTDSVEGLWTFLIAHNSHFSLNVRWVNTEILLLKATFGAYFLQDLFLLSILCSAFALILLPCWGKENLFFFFFIFLTWPWNSNQCSRSSLMRMICFMFFPMFINQICLTPMTLCPMSYSSL